MPKDNQGRRRATPECAPGADPFAQWLADVSRLCLKHWGLRLDDLPDLNTRHAFDAGVDPTEFFVDEVVPMMREDFGSAADIDE